MAAERSSRARSRNPGSDSGGRGSGSLLSLPAEVLDLVMHNLDSISLVMLGVTCKQFRAVDSAAKLRLPDKIAKQQLEQRCGLRQAARWK